MRDGLVFIYGALTEHADPEGRDDIDALLMGRGLPSAARAEAQRQAAMWQIASQGEIG